MSLASKPASRWAVSARTNGEVLTAGISRPELELAVLGVPGGFSQPEIEGWLHDLAGVAVETSRADARTRAIPALMHHALTGLLFSHAELWDKLDAPRPCSCAFVDLPGGAAFGWYGAARVHVLVDGDPVEPRWVRVRDEAGREANAAVFAPGADIVITLQYWPHGEDGGVAPASLEAEWVGAMGESTATASWPGAPEAAAHPAAGRSPAPDERFLVEPRPVAQASGSAPPVTAAQPAPLAHELYPELPETLPVQQPGLASSAHDLPRDPNQPAPLATLIVPIGVDPVPMGAEAAPLAIESRTFEQPSARPFYDEMDGFAPESPASEPFVTEPVASDPFASGPFASDPTAPDPFAFDPPASEPLVSRPIRPRPPASRRPAPAPLVPAEPKPAHPVARWLSRVMKWGRPVSSQPEAVPTEFESAPVSSYDSLLSESVPPTPSEQTEFELASRAPADASRVPPRPAPAIEPSTPGALRPTGFAEILGAPAPAPTSSPSGSFAINQRLQDLLREIEAADAGHMPVISPDVPEDTGANPLQIDHEPVGADASFGIPLLPASLSVGPPEEDRITSIPPLPVARVVVAGPPPAILHSVEALAPPVLPAASAPAPAPAATAAFAPPAAPPPVPAATPRPAQVAAPPTLAAVPVQRATEVVPEAPPMLRVPLPARAPAAAELAGPSPVAPALDLPAPPPPPPAAPDASAGATDDVAPVTPRSARRPRSLDGPESFERPKAPLHRRPAVWAAGVVAVFVVGWLVGGFSSPGSDRGGPVMAALRAIGIGGAHFTANINSSPGGAQIEIDGKPQATRTPATLELPPGEHVVKLLMPGLGSVEVPIKGRNGEKLTVDESLNGSLEILDADSSVPISVSIDGRPAGYAPVKVESLAPGLHEVGFSGPGMPAWAQTVQIDVRGAAQMIARPMTAPASGVIQAQATLNDERGASPLPGAQVYVDGELRGVTPMSIELPRGPHSLRVTWRNETAPVQVIDLPGGNQRFASFNFGLDLAPASVTLLGATRTFASGEPKVVSASLQGLPANDVSEVWLHVRTPEGLWRRYAMTLLRGTGDPVGTAVFPENVFDAQGNTRWYVRVISRQGDETFSEIQRSSLTAPAAKPAARPQR